jgi:hypothetical protein
VVKCVAADTLQRHKKGESFLTPLFIGSGYTS